MLPFTSEVFFALFEDYNRAIWPAQIVAYALGLLVLALAVRPFGANSRIAGGCLAVFWLWNGVVYHWFFFTTINFAAPVFAALFVLQGVLFAWIVLLRGRVAFRFAATLSGWAGLAMVVFALVGYPLTSWLAGHGWPQAPAFGVAPCPTVIFTLGMLLLAEPRVQPVLVVVPLLWSLIGGTAVWLLDVPEDISLPLAGALTLFLMVRKNRAVT